MTVDSDVQPEIIYENENFLAVNKPAGLVVHAVRVKKTRKPKKDAREHEREQEPTLVDWLIEKYPQIKTVGDDPEFRPGIVHRLDKETSGVMLVPKTQEYFEYLKSLFQKHAIQKTYYALVRGVLKQSKGTINAPIGIVNGTLRRSVRSTKMQKEAITEYKVIKVEQQGAETFSLLEVHPLTGRTHQIRVHLASIGHPIVGDRLYGPKKAPASRLMLHAVEIQFPDRDGTTLHLSTSSPAFPTTQCYT